PRPALGVGVMYSVMCGFAGVALVGIRPILLLLPFASVNQSAPSGPEVIKLGNRPGSVPALGSWKNLAFPKVVSLPILVPWVNHIAPSGPSVIPPGSPPKNEDSVMAPTVGIRPILPAVVSTNHNAPSGPAVIPVGSLFGVGTVYVVKVPSVAMRAIVLVTGPPVNHNAPSGPAVMIHWPLGPGKSM